MKRIITLATALLLSLLCLQAQPADFQKAVARYKTATTASATATKTRHNAAMTKEATSKGELTMKKPGHVCISIDGGKDMLLMEGSTFTMTVGGKKHTTTSQGNPQFATFQAVFESILSGGQTDLTKYSDLTIGKQGPLLVLTITPSAADKKAARRIMFTSFVLTIDPQTSALKSLRMNERKGSYTEYTFTNFKLK